MVPVRTSYKSLENRYKRLELDKSLTAQGRNSDFDSIRTEWGAYRDSNPS